MSLESSAIESVAAAATLEGMDSAVGDSASNTLRVPEDATGAALSIRTFPFAFNGGAWDRLRGAMGISVMTSLPRTGTVISATFTTYNLRGGLFFLNVTANPGAAETLTLRFLADGLHPYLEGTPQFGAGGTGTAVAVVGLGVVAADHLAGVDAFGSFLPRSCSIEVVPSNPASSWTYSVTAALK